MNWILRLLFPCGHKRTTFPLTPSRKKSEERRSTYIVCLDCGREFDYNWREMRIGCAIERHVPVPVTKEAV